MPKHISAAELTAKFASFPELKHTVVGASLPSQGFKISTSSPSLDENTQFFIASVSKQFTAFMVLKALYAKNEGNDEGVELDLHAPLSKILEDSPFFDQIISPAHRPSYMSEELAEALKATTIHELLTQTSGLSDFYSSKSVTQKWEAEAAATEAASPTPEQIEAEMYKLICPWRDHIEGIQMAHLLETKDFEYCNTNYLIVGKVIEYLTQMPFAAYSKQLTEDFRLESTLHVDSGSAITVAETYHLERLDINPDDPLSWNGNWDLHETFGNGSLVSTVHDLLEWGPQLASHPYHKLMSTKAAKVSEGEGDSFYGYGLFIADTPSLGLSLSHPGEVGLYRSCLYNFPEQDLHLAILTCDQAELNTLGEAFKELFE